MQTFKKLPITIPNKNIHMYKIKHAHHTGITILLISFQIILKQRYICLNQRHRYHDQLHTL